MVVREAGLLFRGFSLIKASYHQTSYDKIDTDLRSGLLTALLNFAEGALSPKLGAVEYFEMKKYVMAFTEGNITPNDGNESEVLISYAILNREKNSDKYLKKVINPLLKEVLNQFITKFNGKNLSHVTLFKGFKENLDSIFGTDTKTVDQKLEGTFF